MKKLLLIILSLLVGVMVWGQAPQALKYQAVARNSAGEVLANQAVSFRISVLRGSATGASVYTETHTGKTTNAFGLVDLEIGRGSVSSGSFATISWESSGYFLKVEMDPAGGSSYQVMGTTPLLSVPYALHAMTVEVDNVDDADHDATNEIQGLSISGTVLTLSKGGGSVTLPSSGGGDNWGTQTVVSDATLAGLGTTTQPLKIAQQGATSGQVLKWNGSTWRAADDHTGSTDWLKSGEDLYFNTGRVGIGKIPGASDARQFQVLTEGYQAVAAVNNSASYASIFAQNNGSGPAADFRNYIKIIDGTQGTDKVLTSDAYGTASWKTGIWGSDDNYIYNYSGKKFGLGINKPTQKLTLADGSTACYMNIQNSTTGFTSTAGLLIGMEGNNGWVSTYEPGNLYLGTNSAARVTIASDGDVGIGITSPAQKLDVNGAINIRGNGSLHLFCDNQEALWFDGTYFSWGYGGGYNFFGDEVTIGTSAVPGYTLVVNGSAAKTGGGSWTNLSDVRMKDLKGDYLKGLDEIIRLRPVKFTYKPGNPRGLDPGEEQIGFVAQEVQDVFPEAVSQCKDGYLDFNMHTINVALVNAVKALKAENDLLKQQNASLAAEQSNLKARLEQIELLVQVNASAEGK